MSPCSLRNFATASSESRSCWRSSTRRSLSQPEARLAELKTSVELVDDIGIGYGVGELGGSDRIFPSDGNVEYLSLPAARNPQRSPQAIYSIYDGSFRRR